MEITLAPEVEQFIQAQIQSGRYSSAIEVILAGLQLLRDQEQIYKGRFEELRQEISIGLAESEAGEVIDADIVFQSLQAKLQQRRAEANE
ncbi:type II toxin-antitoxin system ParD family antitoxin [Microcoleus sp. FACHB-1515]|uniref:type II toxin-antitoxin system ParD family antitoxin n=1 Tax=Cyanophyceae TaxID=3028117 RepID=UPI00168A0541|nr:type II toxin-antitoxin system ParD family antitoxin [Microcoleus sp. FACHB-1515]MBD2093039.1 type II toxin-antitoxin system ParD family antitoxin [Microcoleus sp. FACHB-1515]